MPRNPANQKKKPKTKTKPSEERATPSVTLPAVLEPHPRFTESPTLEPGEERAVPEVAPLPLGIAVATEPTVDVVTTGSPGVVVGDCEPSGETVVVHVDPKPIEEQPPAPPVQIVERRIEMVTVKIPLGELPTRLQAIHIDIRLDKEHCNTFRRLRQGLRDKIAKTQDGKLVETKPDVIRWLLEKLASS